MTEVQEDEVIFEKIDEDPVTVAMKSTTLTHATSHNVTMLNEKLSQAEFENTKLKDEIISLREEMKIWRKVENDMISLKESILEQKEKLHDLKVECFTIIQKMAHKVKVLEKHLEIVSQINLKMESLQVKIKELGKWRNMERKFPSSLPVVKTYDISLHTLDTSECQELASKFEERARHNLAGMMELYEKSIYYIQRYNQRFEINFEDEHLLSFSFIEEIEEIYERIKVEVQAKEVISKEDIQELLINPLMQYSHYTTFVHKFVINMEKFKECNLALDVKKEHIFNSQEEIILTQHEAWSKHFQKKGG